MYLVLFHPKLDKSAMLCPNCNENNTEDVSNCEQCGFGIRPKQNRKRSSPRYLGDKGEDRESKDELFARGLQCPCCKSYGANRRRITVTGNGISRLLNFQRIEYLVTTCQFCKLTLLHECNTDELPMSKWYIFELMFAVLGTVGSVVAFLWLLSI